MNYNKIKEYAAAKNLTISALCQRIGMSETGFHQAVKNDSLKIRSLEDIANVLEVSPSIFFDGNGDSTTINQTAGVNTGNMTQRNMVGNLKDCQKELERAYERISDLESRIRDKEELIAMLKERR